MQNQQPAWLSASYYENIPHNEVNWAQLAQQWICMKDPPSVATPVLPPSQQPVAPPMPHHRAPFSPFKQEPRAPMPYNLSGRFAPPPKTAVQTSNFSIFEQPLSKSMNERDFHAFEAAANFSNEVSTRRCFDPNPNLTSMPRSQLSQPRISGIPYNAPAHFPTQPTHPSIDFDYRSRPMYRVPQFQEFEPSRPRFGHNIELQPPLHVYPPPQHHHNEVEVEKSPPRPLFPAAAEKDHQEAEEEDDGSPLRQIQYTDKSMKDEDEVRRPGNFDRMPHHFGVHGYGNELYQPPHNMGQQMNYNNRWRAPFSNGASAYPGHSQFPQGPHPGNFLPPPQQGAYSGIPSLLSFVDADNLDAQQRKSLPLWIREGLEKMEREKQKQFEKEEAERLAQEEAWARKKAKGKSRFESDSEDEKSENSDGDVDSERERKKTKKERRKANNSDENGSKMDDFIDEVMMTEEEKRASLLQLLRSLMTEILMSTTANEIELIVSDVYRKKRSKASKRAPQPQKLAQSSAALASIIGFGTDNDDDSATSDTDDKAERGIFAANAAQDDSDDDDNQSTSGASGNSPSGDGTNQQSDNDGDPFKRPMLPLPGAISNAHKTRWSQSLSDAAAVGMNSSDAKLSEGSVDKKANEGDTSGTTAAQSVGQTSPSSDGLQRVEETDSSAKSSKSSRPKRSRSKGKSDRHHGKSSKHSDSSKKSETKSRRRDNNGKNRSRSCSTEKRTGSSDAVGSSSKRHRSSRKSKSRSLSKSPHRKRSRSPKRIRSRSPIRNRSRSPTRNRSRSPLRNRIRSPIRNRSRSPLRNRSRSPIRYPSRSPVRHRSRSTGRYRSRSPLRYRSRSPLRNRSRSPLRNRSRSPLRNRSRSPIRVRSRTRSPVRRRSRSVSPPAKARKSRSRERSPKRSSKRPSSRKSPKTDAKSRESDAKSPRDKKHKSKKDKKTAD